MPKKVTTESFIKKAMNTHGFVYCYSKVKYKDSKTKVIITCKKHGDFEQKPNCHLTGKGCPSCGGKKQLNSKLFIEKSKQIHREKYDYSLVKYKNSQTKVDIICPEHGIFEQRAVNHLQGNGCQSCAVKEHERTGWKLLDWKKAANISKNFDSFKVYIIRCWSEDEKFYKIGRTFTTVKRRFHANFYLPYNYEIIKIFEGEAEEMFSLEKQLQNKNINDKYLPIKKFSGVRECFKTMNYE